MVLATEALGLRERHLSVVAVRTGSAAPTDPFVQSHRIRLLAKRRDAKKRSSGCGVQGPAGETYLRVRPMETRRLEPVLFACFSRPNATGYAAMRGRPRYSEHSGRPHIVKADDTRHRVAKHDNPPRPGCFPQC
jgi:hypothetical protein